VISNILATDIKEHFPMLKKFDDKRSQANNLLTPEDASLLSGIIVHASDFGHSVKEFEICRTWSERVNREFTNQY
jgi:cAMP-specific phosphodiesterase 4